ncbi:MAG: thioredoxin family protein [Verrucomicrobiota bacterium]
MKAILSMLTVFGLAVGSVMAGEFPDGSPDFETDYDKALASAKEAGKPLLVVFSASWCPPCQANKQNVYPSDAVKKYHDKFVWAYLDTDKANNGEVARSFGVSGIPHIQFVSSDGKPLDSTVGGTSPELFAKQLDGVLEKAKS